MKKIASLILFFCWALFSVPSLATAELSANTNSLAPMLEKVSPSVVNVRSQVKVPDLETYLRLQKERQLRGNKGAPIPNKISSVASGVIVDAQKGYILTNAHVIADAQTVTVTLHDGRHFNAKTIGLDKPSDIALLQIQAKNLTAAPIADSNQLKVGDIVVAIGNPFGLNQTVTSGIVSALGRTALGIESYENFIQTDTSINPGNSGGALINIHGQLIGINTAILAPSQGSIGIGFAIPSNMAKSVMEQLIRYGDVRRGALGIGAQDITPELATAFNINNIKGAVVTIVMPNSPAKEGGLLPGDIITGINGSPIKTANDVVNIVAFLRVDSNVTLNVLRKNKTLSFTVRLSDPKKREETTEKMDPYLYGVGLKDLSVSSPIHGTVNGVYVMSVEEDTNAWHANLMPGDVIVSANQKPVVNTDELKKIAAETKQGLLVNILRGNSALFLVISREQ